jgi:chromate transporter
MGELVGVFLRISLLGFGGPNAHLALMLDEVVERRGWLTREHFLQLVGVTNLLPGPNSSEVAIHIGYTQRGWRGALATGLAFLSPTFVLVVLFSWLYFRFGTLPQVEGIFWGLKPAILAVILAAGWKLAKVALEGGSGRGTPDPASTGGVGSLPPHRLFLLLLATGGVATSVLLDRWEVGAMAVGGLLGWGVLRRRDSRGPKPPQGSEPPSEESPDGAVGRMGFLLLPATASIFPSAAAPLGQLFGLMLGTGAVLFGGGYMLVALLEPFVVGSFGWLTPEEFLDGIALTQAVPGPIVTLVAFVGFAVAGVPGAFVATGGIYLPSFAAVLLVAPVLDKWRHMEGVAAALKGVNAVVAGAILGVGLTLLPSALEDLWGAAILMAALVALIRFRAKAIWLVMAGIGAGLIHALLAG